jgi:hypothetical protein
MLLPQNIFKVKTVVLPAAVSLRHVLRISLKGLLRGAGQTE